MSGTRLRGSAPIHTLCSVEPGDGPYDVDLIWGDGPRAGDTVTVDLAPVILAYKVFLPLRDDRDLFRTVRLAEFGEAIEWGEGDDLAIAGTTLERLAEETMTNADFAAFLKRHGLTRDAAAGQLGIARRLVSYYAKDRPIPRYIAFACRYLDSCLHSPAGMDCGSHPADYGFPGKAPAAVRPVSAEEAARHRAP